MVQKKKLKLFAVLTLIAGFVGAQTTVEFYSTVSSSDDAEMINMTTNLFYTQMQELDGYKVIDRRDREFSGADDFVSDLAFFAEIQESGSGWICTLNAIDRKSARLVTDSNTYASYYKILLDAKSSLEKLFSTMESDEELAKESQEEDVGFEMTLDTLAGTWTGDSLIEKIVILRGGKGFVIFKNGASMNIGVSLEGKAVTVTQKGRSNASFYPELSRDVALQNATTASPIKWQLTVLDEQTMKGIKMTLKEDKKSSTGASTQAVDVEWIKSAQ